MQNIYKRLSVKKAPAVILSIFFLFALIIAACCLERTYALQIQGTTNVDDSMYIQLESLAKSPVQEQETEQKMNNKIFENANNSEFLVSDSFSVETLKVLDHKTGTVFNQPLEEYTLCVTLAEMPQSFDAQALMAQAVAIRTFVARNVKLGSKHKNADVCTDYRCCQSYKHIENIDFDISKATEAVNATKGIIAIYNDEPILAAYHSSSVGYTKSSKSVWGGDVPYLVPVLAVESRDVTGKKTVVAEDNVLRTLSKYGINNNFTFQASTDGLCSGVKSDTVFLTPAELKRAFSLYSDTFDVTYSDNTYTFTSYGYGHGVGMSQYGADALAKQGYDFYQILKYYYTGIEFDFVN